MFREHAMDVEGSHNADACAEVGELHDDVDSVMEVVDMEVDILLEVLSYTFAHAVIHLWALPD